MPVRVSTIYRGLFKRPSYSLAVLFTLMLGIGANSAIFSVINAVLLQPLPYPDGNRLMALHETSPAQKMVRGNVAPVQLEEWNRLNQTLQGVSGAYTDNFSETSGALPEKIACAIVAPRFFPVLGTAPLLGRGFSPEEDLKNGPSVAVISERFWMRRFGRDAHVLGRTLRFRTTAYTIVGVIPDTFRFPASDVEVWIAAQMPDSVMRARNARFYSAVARLKPNVTREQAQADLNTVQARLGLQYPATDANWTVQVDPLKEETVSGVRRSLWLLFGAVFFVLLIACGNVACLMLVRAGERERDIAVRFSLGARRSQVIGELLLEALCLAIPSGALGLLLAAWGTDLFRQAAAKLPRADEIQLDWRVVAFTFSLSISTTLLFALAPAIYGTRRELAGALAFGSRTQTGARNVLQRGLVATEIALAIVLLAGAGLLGRSLARLGQVSLGFEPEHVLALRISAGWGETVDSKRVARRMDRTLETLRAIPGVQAAAIGIGLPGTGQEYLQKFQIAGRDNLAAGSMMYSDGGMVSADYFRVLGIPLLAGETCRAGENGQEVQPVLVNRTFSERFFAGNDSIGHELTLNANGVNFRMRIIGVASDSREHGYGNDPSPFIYSCGTPGSFPDPYYLLKTSGAPMSVAAAVRRKVHEIEPARAVYEMVPLSESLGDTLSARRFQMLLLSLFALTALLLAGIGLYGVMSFLAAQRTREIGLRLAIGARPSQIFAQIIRQGAGIVVIGIVAGLGCAVALTRVVAVFLFGVKPLDPVTFISVPALLAVIAFAALAIPAQRAMRVDPLQALRQD